VNLWVTINEPNVFATFSYLQGLWPPGKKDFGAFTRVTAQLVRAHAAAYRTIHELQPSALVGIASQHRERLPCRSWFLPDCLIAGLQSQQFNLLIPHALHSGVLRFPAWIKRIPEAKGTQDFFGLNYYTRNYVKFSLDKEAEVFAAAGFAAEAEVSESGMLANDPQGFFDALRWSLRFKVPVYVTENGVEDSEDGLRRRYLARHIHAMWRGVNFNWPVRGYFHWSLLDNFEWERGWTQRFGLWELDMETQARRKRPSADLYAEICRENGISTEMVERYAPEALEKLIPQG
jgi:beta-glucosidase